MKKVKKRKRIKTKPATKKKTIKKRVTRAKPGDPIKY